MTTTGQSDHDAPAADAAPAAGPTDRELLTGEGSIRDRKAAPVKPVQGEKTDRALDRELDQTMDGSDPPSVTQP